LYVQNACTWHTYSFGVEHGLARHEGKNVARSPAASRRRLGAELRGLRESAGKRIEDAAQVLRCSTAKISRLENGKGVPFERDVRDLIDAYGPEAQERRDYLYELVEEARAQDWFSAFRDVFQSEMTADHLHRFFELERDASAIKTFEADLVPGLLQTEEYIDAVCSIVFPERSEKERARFVEFRRTRQEILLRQAEVPQLSVILNEAAIMRRIGGPAVMRRQLEALLGDLDGRLKFVEFRMIPMTGEARGALGGPFSIMKYDDPHDQDVVYLEGREGAHYLETDDDVARYERIFSGLERESLSRDDSLSRIAHEVERLQ
jgi:transcriptional regulator with XRE-family HTH domain